MTIFWKNHFFRRGIIIVFTCFAILGTAFSCSGSLFNRQQVTYGLLKRDPEFQKNQNLNPDGFVKANAVRTLEGNLSGQGLEGLSVLKIYQVTESKLYLLTKEKGIFKTNDGGSIWERMYVFPLTGNTESDLAKNDNLEIIDFDVDRRRGRTVYLAAILDGVSKIYQSLDEGATFREIYTEIQNKEGVSFIRVDPINTNNVFAIIEAGALIRSRDNGITWQKIRSFRDTPVDMGFVPEFDELFYILFDKEGLATSDDLGETWDIRELKKADSEIGEKQPTDGLDISFKERPTFGKYEKIVPVTADIDYDYENRKILENSNRQPWILVADRQMWFTEDINQDFKKLVLPSQAEQYDIFDIAPDPQAGLGKIYVSVDNRLFMTTNQGVSWVTRDMIQVSEGNIGYISQVLLDASNPEIIYLGLVNEKARRNKGFFIF